MLTPEAALTPEIWLALAVFVPLLGGLVVLLWPDTIIRGVRPLLAVVFAGVTVYCALRVALALTASSDFVSGLHLLKLDGRELTWSLGAGSEAGRPYLAVSFYIDRLAVLAVLAASVLTLLVTFYAWGALARNPRRGEFLAFALWALAGAILAAAADNLLVMLIGWELVSVMLFYLVTIGGDRARYSAGKTMVMLGFGDGALLLGIVALFCLYGVHTLSISKIIHGARPVVGGLGAEPLAMVAFGLMVLAGLVKAGAMPVHSWLPKAAEGAPPATMALLPASIDKLLGIYLLTRACLFLFDWKSAPGAEAVVTPQLLLMILGALTVLLAVMAALVQHDLKKLLAYHAVSQVGYMVLGIATGTAVGVVGGLFHMLNNAIYKNALFLGAGAIENRTGTTDLGRLGGLGRKMPMTFGSMLVSALSISGVPLTNGFVSKWLIFAGLLQYAFAPEHSAAAVIFLVVAMFGSALTVASFVKVLHSAFMGPATRECAGAREVGVTMWSPMVVLSGLCLALGVAPYYVISNFLVPIAAEAGLSPGGAGVTAAFPEGIIPGTGGFWSPLLAAALIVAALAGGAVIFLLGTFRRARTVRPFLSGETTAFTAEETRFPGTGFYGTVLELGALNTIYRDAAEGAYDLYEIIGHAGERLVEVGRRLHNGVLPTYLAYCMLGLLAVLAALLVPLLLGS